MKLHPSVIAALLASIPVFLGAQAAPKTSVVIASVTDAQSGQPISDAEVRLSDLNVSAKTDWIGEARIANIGAGQHTFQIVKPGYDSMVVALQVQGDSVGPVFRLIKSGAATLAPAKVPADRAPSYLAEFEKRRKEGHGKYLTEDELEKKGNRPLVEVLAQSMGGLMASPDPLQPGQNILTTRRAATSLDRGRVHCGVDIYLDSQRYGDDLNSLRPGDLAGVEYYPIESAPSEYRRPTDNCGILLLWSKK